LLDKVGIQDEIKRIRDDRLKRSTIASPEEILEMLTAHMRTLPNELVDENNNFIPLSKLTRDQAAAIAGIKVKRRMIPNGENPPIVEDTIEYKLVDRLKAAEMLARHHELFDKDNRQKPTGTGAGLLVALPAGVTNMSLVE
jgi:Terminase small subunit